MKLRKVTINGKTYYEEIREEESVIEPEVLDEKRTQKIKYDYEEESVNSNETIDKYFSKEHLKKDWNEFVSSMKGLGKNISKKVKHTTRKWFQDSPDEDKTDHLVKILPYMSKDDIHDIVKRIIKNDREFQGVDYAAIMPFISRKDCDALFMKVLKDGDTISINMAHFVSDDCLSALVDRYIDGKCPGLDIDALYPFLSSSDVKKLFYYELKKNRNKKR